MSDDLDLSVIERHHDADPEFRDALRAHLTAILVSEQAPIGDVSDEADTIDVAVERAARPEHSRRRVMIAVAALVGAAAALATVVVVTSGDGSIEPVDDTVVPTNPTIDETVPATDPAVDDTAPTAEPATDITPDLFTDIAPGSTIDLPEAPIAGRSQSVVVWTGTEMIVWGGSTYDRATDTVPSFDDGAAFDLATGVWRVIAPAPLRPRFAATAVWTGTEMIVWGGFVDEDVRTHDGAAYNPTSDSWRMLPATPFSMGSGNTLTPMVWTGDEAIVTTEAATAAYDPVTDSWRRLDHIVGFAKPIWTGDAIVWVSDNLTRWDPETDTWTTVPGAYADVVGIPGADGDIATFIAVPTEVGAPVHLLDADLTPISELPAFPGTTTEFGPTVDGIGQFVGDEIIFHIWAGKFPYEPTQVWSLDPDAQTWRQLDLSLPEELVVIGDVILTFSGPDGPRAAATATAYRADNGTDR
jgi:hypothetical protein